MLFDTKFNQIEDTWNATIISPSSSLILAKNAILLFKDFINALFDIELLKALGVSSTQSIQYDYNIEIGYPGSNHRGG